jgi:hypothetical protein
MRLGLHTKFVMTEKVFPLAGLLVAIAGLPLGQIQAPPIDGVGRWAWSLIGFLAIILLVLNVVLASKKLLGRNPPLADVLSGMATLKHVDGLEGRIIDLKNEQHARARGLEEQISALRHEMRNEYGALKMAADERREILDERLAELRAEIAGMRERTTAHHGSLERKVDTLDGKVDRLIERLSQNPRIAAK